VISAGLSSWGALCQTQMEGPCPLSLPSPYPCGIPNSLPFKVGFGTYRDNDDKCTHTDLYIIVIIIIIIIIIVNEFHRDASLTKTSGLYNMIIPI